MDASIFQRIALSNSWVAEILANPREAGAEMNVEMAIILVESRAVHELDGKKAQVTSIMICGHCSRAYFPKEKKKSDALKRLSALKELFSGDGWEVEEAGVFKAGEGKEKGWSIFLEAQMDRGCFRNHEQAALAGELMERADALLERFSANLGSPPVLPLRGEFKVAEWLDAKDLDGLLRESAARELLGILEQKKLEEGIVPSSSAEPARRSGI